MKSRRSDTGSDLDRVKDALQSLKSENRKLRKENSQLRKQLHRGANDELDTAIKLEEELASQFPVQYALPEKENTEKCPKCRESALVKIKAGRYVIKLCEECGYKKRTDNKV